MRWGRVATVLVVAFGVGFFGYLLLGQENAQAPSTEVVDMTWIDARPRLVRADDSGVVMSVENVLRGVSRTGEIAWQQPPGIAVGEIVCGAQCPAAILSGDQEFLAADPPPTLLAGATVPDGWAAPADGTNMVLASSGEAALRLVSDARGSAQFESMLEGDRASSSFASTTAGWNMLAPNQRTGVLLGGTPTQGSSMPRAFARLGDHGWTVEGTKATVVACISSEGDRWVEDSIMTWTGRQGTVPSIASGGHCEFTASSVVFGPMGEPGEVAVTAVDSSGTVLWSKPQTGVAYFSADPTSGQVAVAVPEPGREMVSVFDETGQNVLQIPRAVTARFTATGVLVTSDLDGVVTWHES